MVATLFKPGIEYPKVTPDPTDAGMVLNSDRDWSLSAAMAAANDMTHWVSLREAIEHQQSRLVRMWFPGA